MGKDRSGLSPLVYSAYCICKSHKLHFPLLPSLFSLPFALFFAHTDTQKQAKTKDIAIVRIKYSYKMPTTVSTQTKEPLFTQKAMAMKQPEEDHMVEKNQTGDNHAVTRNHKTPFCFSLTLTHTYRLRSVARRFGTRGLGVSRLKISLASFSSHGSTIQTEQDDCGRSHCNYMFFYILNIYLHKVFVTISLLPSLFSQY